MPKTHMTRYFRPNTLKQTLAEDWRMARSWKVVFLWLYKLFRHRLYVGSPCAIPVPFREFAIDTSEVPAPAAAMLLEPLRQASQLGFELPRWQRVPTMQGESVTTAATLRHSGGQVVARLVHVHFGAVHPPKQQLSLNLTSRLADGRLFTTCNRPQTYNALPNTLTQRFPDAPLTVLMEHHQRKLAEFQRDAGVEHVASDVAVEAFADRLEQEAMAHYLQRGVFEEVPAAEVVGQPPPMPGPPPVPGASPAPGSPPPDPGEAALLTEIERIQNDRGSWTNGLIVAAVSLGLFMAAGGLKWDWSFALLLTGAILLHEAGHYAAMRLFKYRNLRMFFVPLVGAAVTGRHYNVPGWKQVLVSLAGPVPGIAVGLGAAIYMVLTGDGRLEQAAILLFVLNGLNLLPVLPLDGGWVLNAVLFSRHFKLELAFRLVAALALLGATFMGWGRFWFVMGIFMLMGLPVAYRLAKAAHDLRRSGATFVSPDDQSIPVATALTISRQLKAVWPGTVNLRDLATHTLSVFKHLNDRPPGVLASLALLGVYLGALVAAFVGLGLVYAAKPGGLEHGALLDTGQPRLVWQSDQVRQPALEDWRLAALAEPCAVALFPGGPATNRSEKIVSRYWSDFGQSLFLSGAGASTNQLLALGANPTNVFLEVPASNLVAFVQLRCEAPDEAIAQRLARECQRAMAGAWLGLRPPWVEAAGLTDADRETMEKGRFTWERLQAIETRVKQDREVRRISHEMARQFGEDATNALQEAFSQHHEATGRAYVRELERERANRDPRFDSALADVRLAQFVAEEEAQPQTLSRLQEALRARYLLLPLSNSLPATVEGWQGARSGAVAAHDRSLIYSYLSFRRTELGLPALVAYLEKQGCREIRYDLSPPVRDDEEDEARPASEANASPPKTTGQP
jgi:Zn-dependent protease